MAVNKDNYLIFDLIPEDYEGGRCKIADWVWNDDSCFKLKMYISACELNTEGGFDTQEFVGKAITCHIAHNKSKDKTKTYANVVMESLRPYGSDMAKPDNPNDPFEDTPPPPTDDDAPPEKKK